MLEAFHLALTCVLAVVVGVGCVALVQLWIELKAMKASTHTLTYIDPLQQQYSEKPTDPKANKKLTDDPLGNFAMDGMGGLDS